MCVPCAGITRIRFKGSVQISTPSQQISSPKGENIIQLTDNFSCITYAQQIMKTIMQLSGNYRATI